MAQGLHLQCPWQFSYFTLASPLTVILLPCSRDPNSWSKDPDSSVFPITPSVQAGPIPDDGYHWHQKEQMRSHALGPHPGPLAYPLTPITLHQRQAGPGRSGRAAPSLGWESDLSSEFTPSACTLTEHVLWDRPHRDYGWHK